MTQSLVADPGISDQAVVPNAKRLLWAGFAAIFAAGVGMAVRGGILGAWRHDYGFSASQVGDIGGAGFTGFCFGIIIGGLLADKIGYGKLVAAAFGFHVLSAIVTLAAPSVVAGQPVNSDHAFKLLYWGTFIFAIANGTLEGVANPLVATLFPHNRMHFLNILHASWPAGLIVGGVIGWTLGDQMHIGWKIQLALYLVPTLFYGLMFLGQKMPQSEAAEKGLSFGQMFKDVGILGALVVCFLLSLFFAGVLQPLLPGTPDHAAHTAQMIGYAIAGALLIAVAVVTKFSFGALLLFVLFITHALVGAVELGTDGWIQNITGTLLSPSEGKILFVWTSALMFMLRFCGHFIEKTLKLSPIALLTICASLACVGLNLVSGINSFVLAMLALSVYALGKTFFWPTMLAVASDRFPRSGAIAISIMGGIGMLSAGLIGSKGLGYANDRFAGEDLQKKSPALYSEYKNEKGSKFLVFAEATGLDGKKLEDATETPVEKQTGAQKTVIASNVAGARATLRADSAIPAAMAVIYLMLFLYFKAIGGYKTVHLAGTHGADPRGAAV